MSDDAITKERIEAIGFQSGMYGLHFFWLLIVDTRARNRVYVGRAAHGATPLDTIKTMTQLTNLIKALRGET